MPGATAGGTPAATLTAAIATVDPSLYIPARAMSLADLRREYNLTGLRRKDLDPDPIRQFQRWFDQATGARASGQLRRFFVKLYKRLLMIGGLEIVDINDMTPATVNGEGKPSARVVLLKGIDERGFVFFTNYTSRKGREMAVNPNAALVCYWPELERQVTIAGKVTQVPGPESDAYFA